MTALPHGFEPAKRQANAAQARLSESGLTFVENNVASLAPLADVTRDHVLTVLEACGGRQTLAAAVLKIDRKTIYRMLRRWGVDARGHASEP